MAVKITNKKISLEWDVNSCIAYDSPEVIYETFLTEVKKYLNILKWVDGDISALNDFVFYNLLTSLYVITLEGEDLLEIFSMAKGREYDRFEIARTNMCFEVESECGESIKAQQLYDVAVAKDYTSKIANNITHGALQKLASTSSVIVVASKSAFVSKLPRRPRKMKSFPKIELLKNYGDFFETREYALSSRDMLIRESEYYPYLISFLREKIPVRDICMAMKKYIEELDKQIKGITNIDYNICRDCKRWFDSSREKVLLEKALNQSISK